MTGSDEGHSTLRFHARFLAAFAEWYIVEDLLSELK